MTISAKASFLSKASYTVNDTYGNKVNTDSDARNLSLTYTHGTGNLQINNGVTVSGTLVASEHKRFDLYNDGSGILYVSFGITGGVPLDRIKHISIFNLETTKDANFDVVSTGSDNIALFSTSVDTSGAQRIRPYSSFVHNDPYTGLAIENESKYIYLHDVSGSGCKFSMLFMGVDESQPTGVTSSTSPYF
jgi:hypothetical protein